MCVSLGFKPAEEHERVTPASLAVATTTLLRVGIRVQVDAQTLSDCREAHVKEEAIGRRARAWFTKHAQH